MSQLSCRNYLEAPPERQDLIAAWMSGYFNAARNMPTVDFGRFATNRESGHEILPGAPQRQFDERHSQSSFLKQSRAASA